MNDLFRRFDLFIGFITDFVNARSDSDHIYAVVADRIAAIDRLLERGFGKTAQEVGLIQADSSELEERLESMTTAGLEAHLARLENVIEPGPEKL